MFKTLHYRSKACLCISLLLLVVFSSVAQSNFGLRGGINFNRVRIKNHPDNYIKYASPKTTASFHLGAFYLCKISDLVAILPEIQMSQKEIAYEHYGNKSSFTNMYFEANVLTSFKIISEVKVLAGPYAAYLASSKPRGRFNEDFDFGLSGGVNVGISKYMDAIVRYQHGLLPIYKAFSSNAANTRELIIKEYNRTLQIGVSYRFKESRK